MQGDYQHEANCQESMNIDFSKKHVIKDFLNYIWHFWSKWSVGALLKSSSVKRESLWSLSLECPWNKYRKSERCAPATMAISKKKHIFLFIYVFGAHINQKAVNNLQECWTVTKLFMMKAKVIKYSFFFFFNSCKMVKLNKVSSTPVLCLLLSLLLPNSDGKEADCEHFGL